MQLWGSSSDEPADLVRLCTFCLTHNKYSDDNDVADNDDGQDDDRYYVDNADYLDVRINDSKLMGAI